MSTSAREKKALKEVCERNCPVTGGAEVKMTEAGFRRTCELKRDKKIDRCKKCKAMPEEVIIIELPAAKPKEEDMASETEPGTCNWCGKAKKVKPYSGKQTCSYCYNAVAIAKNNADILVKILEEHAPKALANNSEEDKSDAMKKLQIEMVDIMSRNARLSKENAILQSNHMNIMARRDELKELSKMRADLLNNLALRLATAMLRGDFDGITVDDIEMLGSC